MTIGITSLAGILLVLALLASLLLAGRCVSRHRAQWSAGPDAKAPWPTEPPEWWSRPVAGHGLRNSVRDIAAPCPFDVPSVVDARVVMSATRSPKRMRRGP